MAAVRHPQSSLRTAVDPFNDPPSSHRRPPPVPPKAQPKSQPKSASRMPAPVPKPPVAPNPELVDAIRDTVVVHKSADNSPTRNRVGRSHTTLTPPSAVRQPTRRSLSQDSAHNTADRSRGSAKSRSKKGSQYADVIDRLDYTGPGPMLHHDGPFDACAPSRNRQRNKAPIYSWTTRPEDELRNNNGLHPSGGYSDLDYPVPQKKRVDAIAEAWGIHEPEPYEEFFAGGGTTRTPVDTPANSIYNGHDPHSTRPSAKTSSRDDPQSSSTRTRGPTRRHLVPPPQPIFVPGSDDVDDLPGSPPYSAPIPKRTRSLMHRIRKMRDSPNVPVSTEYDPPSTPTSPTSPIEHSYPGTSTRPSHRSQNSFLGRLGSGKTHNTPTMEMPEPFVYIEANTKDLQESPLSRDTSAENTPIDRGTSPAPGLVRKTSLMKKMGRVVGRSRQ